MVLKQAESVLTILQEGSITAAAQKLYISQPALSQMLKNLENELNAQIFLRGTNPLQLTSAGKKYVESARKYLVMERSFESEIADISKTTPNILRFGLPKESGLYFVPTIVPEFLNKYPQVDLRLKEADSVTVEKLLLNMDIDLGLAHTRPVNQELEYTLVKEDSLILLADKNSEFGKKHSQRNVDFSELANEFVISKSVGNRSRYIFDRMCETFQVYPKIFFEFENFEVGVRVALNCGGILLTSISAYQLEELQIKERMAVYQINDFDNTFNYYLCHYKNLRLTPYMKYFISEIIQFYRHN